MTEATTEAANPIWGDDWPEVRALWPLEATVAHLNHGSFGAVPTPVLEEQRSWRDRMESNPNRFFTRELRDALYQARSEVAAFLGAEDGEIAFVRNATTAASTVLASLRLAPGDELLLTDHAYGAVRIAADRVAADSGARVVEVPLSLQADEDAVVDAVLAAVTDRTRLALLDQVTSATAWRVPLVRLLPALRERGVATFVDGAHAPGMLSVELDRLGADYWTGNLHKWCCTPRGTAVLHAAPERRSSLRPLAASWEAAEGYPHAFDWLGTDDLTAWLAAPRALRVMDRLGWDRVRTHNVALVVEGQRALAAALGLAEADLPRDPAVSMQLVPLPAGVAGTEEAAEELQALVGEQIATEIAVSTWRGQGYLRLSAQVYNCPADYQRLARDLPALL